MKKRFISVSADADQKQAERFDRWLSGEGIPFADDNAIAAYRGRVSLIKDANQLKKSDSRIPICPSAGFFPIQYAGASMYEAMDDYEILTGAWKKYCHDFTPDAYNAPTAVVPGKALDILVWVGPKGRSDRWPASPATSILIKRQSEAFP